MNPKPKRLYCRVDSVPPPPWRAPSLLAVCECHAATMTKSLRAAGQSPRERPERTRRARPQARRGADIRRTVDVSFEEAVTGTKRRIDFQPGKAVDVTIPAGVEDGQVLRLKGLGHPGAYGGPAGAGLVEVKIRPHPFFRREGDDIRVDLPITLKEALQGGKVRAPTVEGPVEVRVPEGTSSGALLRLRGKGVPKPDGTRGDQIVRLMIDIPVNDPQLDSFVETWTPPADYDPRKRFRRSS